jgi:hypothetical protein
VVNEMTNMLLHGMLHRPIDDDGAPNA